MTGERAPLHASFQEALYRPVADEAQYRELESRVARARSAFIAHGASWLVTSGFFVVVGLLTMGPEMPLAGRLWPMYAIFGWGIGVTCHAVVALVAAPRALAAQREALAVRGLQEAPAAGRLSELAEDLARSARFVKAQIKALDPPRLDLEANLEVAEREATRLLEALLALEEGSRSPATRRADAARRRTLEAERQRLRAALEQLRVTLSNLEIDALLVGTAPSTSAFAMASLATEAELLRAAVEGAQQAREAIEGGAPRARTATPPIRTR